MALQCGAHAHVRVVAEQGFHAPQQFRLQRLQGPRAGLRAAAVERGSDGRRPQASSPALQALETELLRRMETLFRDYPDMRVRAALKRHVLNIGRAGDAMRRLALHDAA